MSFILDALKKLEREKQSREPGVVMVGQVPWGGADRRRHGRLFGAAAAALILALAVGLWWLSVAPVPSAPGIEPPSRPGSSPPGEPDRPATPPRPPAEEAAAPRPGTGGGAASRPVSAPLAPPVPRELDLPNVETTAASAEPGSGLAEAQPVVPEPSSLAADTETPPESPIEPFDAPALTPSAPGPGFRLTAISTRDGEPIALLNDRLVKEGDSFDGVRVIRIGEIEVEIEVDGERRTIGF